MAEDLPGWQGRLRDASYESPSGIVLAFDYEDVTKSFAKHASAYDFPNVNGTYVQPLGNSGRRIPLRIFFSGDDCDLTADVFDTMLAEHGVGTLNHPRYGAVQVVPFGDVNRDDPLVTNTNQVIFTVLFWETNELLFPLDTESPGDLANAAVEALLEVNPGAFAAAVDTPTVLEERTLIDDIRAIATRGKNALQAASETVAAVQRQVDAIDNAINTAIDTFVGTPLTLAFQVGQMLTLPARSAALISDKLNAYGDLLTSLTTEGTVSVPGNDSQSVNTFYNTDMQSAVLLAGMATALIEEDFATQPEALIAAAVLLDACDAWAAWRDDNLAALDVIDTGEQYEATRLCCLRTAGFLVQISFTLKQQRSIVLVRARSPIELEAELYGTVDENLDFLIRSNSLVGLELLEIPRGRRVVYFV